jgi:hypothetical protein
MDEIKTLSNFAKQQDWSPDELIILSECVRKQAMIAQIRSKSRARDLSALKSSSKSSTVKRRAS